MTREHKLALIIGFTLVLVVGVLISDHFSKARASRVDNQVAEAPARNLAVDGLRPVGMGSDGTFGPAMASAGSMPGAPPSELPPVHEPMTQGYPTGIVMGSTLPSESAEGPISVDVQRYSAGAAGGPNTLMHESMRRLDPSAGSGEGLMSPNVPEPGAVRPVQNVPSRSPLPEFAPVNPTPTPAPVVREDTVNGVPLRLCSRHDVKEGESIYRIAKEMYGDGTLWPKLREYNKGKIMDNGGMREGVTLLLPPKEALLGRPLPATVEPSTPRDARPARPGSTNRNETTVAAASKARTYVVQKGDILSEVARKMLGSSRRWTEIHELNKDILDSEDSLQVGMTLKLPAR